MMNRNQLQYFLELKVEPSRLGCSREEFRFFGSNNSWLKDAPFDSMRVQLGFLMGITMGIISINWDITLIIFGYIIYTVTCMGMGQYL